VDHTLRFKLFTFFKEKRAVHLLEADNGCAQKKSNASHDFYNDEHPAPQTHILYTSPACYYLQGMLALCGLFFRVCHLLP
jgi:hypothetical protein